MKTKYLVALSKSSVRLLIGLLISSEFERVSHCVKSVRIRSYSDLHFCAFGLNTEIRILNV